MGAPRFSAAVGLVDGLIELEANGALAAMREPPGTYRPFVWVAAPVRIAPDRQ